MCQGNRQNEDGTIRLLSYSAILKDLTSIVKKRKDNYQLKANKYFKANGEELPRKKKTKVQNGGPTGQSSQLNHLMNLA